MNTLYPVYTEKGKCSRSFIVRLFATPWTVAYQAPLSMGSSRQEYRSGLPFPSLQGSNLDLPHCRKTIWATREAVYTRSSPSNYTSLGEVLSTRNIPSSFCYWSIAVLQSCVSFYVLQSESAMCIHISPLPWISFPFRSPKITEKRCLCYTVGSH